MLRLLDAHRHAIDTCVFCPKLCRFACPVSEAAARETVTPWGLMTRIDDVHVGRAPLDAASGDLWTHCTGCHRCQAVCKHDNDVPEVLLDARAAAAAAGHAPAALLAWGRSGTPPQPAFEALPEGGPVRLVPGHVDDATVQAAVRLLDAAGHGPLGRPIGGAGASGVRLLEAGLPEAFDVAAGRLAAGLEGARLVVCLDPGDALALRRDLPARGRTVPARVQHLTEAVAGRLANLTPVLEGDVLYLDACRLGRGLGVYDAPRRTLEAVITGRVVEAVMHHAEGGCCGAGAGLAATQPALAAQVGREAVADVPRVPVVVASGVCASHLRVATAGRTVHGWATLVARALGAPSQEEE